MSEHEALRLGTTGPQYVEGNYTLQDLRNITDGFSISREIGKGGFGVVYKGTYSDGRHIAVKKLFQNLSTNNHVLFKREATNLMGLEHDNVVRLLGYCYHIEKIVARYEGRLVLADSEERLLCFEYISNGSLDTILSDHSREFEWGMHFKIIQGISEGLRYLHNHEKGRIVHLDLKPNNILLGSRMEPKIADFGLSRLFGIDQTRTFTENLVCTRQYAAPEYLERGEISTKVDIYSLGIVILEVVTGQRITNNSQENRKTVRQTWSTLSQVTSRYPSLQSKFLKEVTGCIDIGIQCVHQDPERRPTANQIAYMLHKLPQLKEGQIFVMDQSIKGLGYILCGKGLNIAWSNDSSYWRWDNIPNSRFAECPVLIHVCWFHIIGKIPARDLKVGTTYRVYLLFRRNNQTRFPGEQGSSIRLASGMVISKSKVCIEERAVVADNVNCPANRKDGWLELYLGGFVINRRLAEAEEIIADIYEKSDNFWKAGIIVEGMEFRPVS